MTVDLWRAVRNALGFGNTTAEVRMVDSLPTVQVRLSQFEVFDLRVSEQRGFASNMPVGTPVVAQFQTGQRSNGTVTGSLAPSTRPALSGPEDAAMYGYGFVIWLAADGIHITAPDVFLTGNLHVNGQVYADSGVGQVGLSTHHHGPDTHGDSVPGPIPGT